jgi:hypothetical protein
MTDPVDVDAARARANAATPGPWSAADEHELLGADATPSWCVSRMKPGFEQMSDTEGYLYDIAYLAYEDAEADAVFIAAARSDVPALADEVKRLRTREIEQMAVGYKIQLGIDKLRAERDAALAEVTRLTAIIESAENLCARRCFSAALGGGSDD